MSARPVDLLSQALSSQDAPSQEKWTRRGFLRRTLSTGIVLGAASWADLLIARGDLAVEEVLKAGRKIGVLPFQAEPELPFGVPVASGLDTRVYLDLAQLDPKKLIIPNEAFYVRTGVPDQLASTADWRISLGGMGAEPVLLPWHDILGEQQDYGVHLMECAGNARQVKFGLIGAAEWSGIPVSAILDRMPLLKKARAVKISGFDGHSRGSTNSTIGCSWIFTCEQLETAGAFFATQMNGRPLSPAHGFPVRLLVPGWYGCCAIKWVDRIEWVESDAPATSQMIEFAGRTHQSGAPSRALDYLPAIVDPAAMPIRVEAWQVGEKRRYRVVGLLWGGETGRSQLEIRFQPNTPYVKVSTQPERADARTWTLWSHVWDPSPGPHLIQMRFDDPALQTRRLDMGLYLRGVQIPAI